MLRRIASHLPTLVAALVALTIATAAGAVVLGDVDQNGQVEALDLAALQKHFEGTYALPSPEAADVAPDGGPVPVIDAEDMALLYHVLSQLDYDDDGLTASEEREGGSSPFTADTDGDGLSDFIEVNAAVEYDDPAFAATLDPALADTDGDGVLDGDEDYDGDGATNAQEILAANPTSPATADSDGDGLCDFGAPGALAFEDVWGPIDGPTESTDTSDAAPFMVGDITVEPTGISSNIGAGYQIDTDLSLPNHSDALILRLPLANPDPVPGPVLRFPEAVSSVSFEAASMDTAPQPMFEARVGSETVGRFRTNPGRMTPVVLVFAEPTDEVTLLATGGGLVDGLLVIDELAYEPANVTTLPDEDIPNPVGAAWIFSLPQAASRVSFEVADPGDDPLEVVLLASRDGSISDFLQLTVPEVGGTFSFGFRVPADEIRILNGDLTLSNFTWSPAPECFVGEDLNRDGALASGGGGEPLETDPTERDTDGDALSDLLEVTLSGGGLSVYGPVTTDPLRADTDGDGANDREELAGDPFGYGWIAPPFGHGTDPNDPDMDDDGFLDGWELAYGLDPNDSQDPDSSSPSQDLDGDGLDLLEEYAAWTDPASRDTDGDGLCDGSETKPSDLVCIYGSEVGNGTNPAVADTDGGGARDGFEVHYGMDPLDPVDDLSDLDGDGLSAAIEDELRDQDVEGTDPTDPDTDGDGLCDGYLDVPGVCVAGEDLNGNGNKDSNETNAKLADTDDDGLLDGWERTHGFDPVAKLSPEGHQDNDQDGLINIYEQLFGTSPATTDTDGDGFFDGYDTDGDGIPDGDEALHLRSNPNSIDGDGDGIFDDVEVLVLGTDPARVEGDDDGDGVPNEIDNCVLAKNGANPGEDDQADIDGDGVGDACDRCEGDDTIEDPDWDGLCGAEDSCPNWPAGEGDCLCGDVDDNGSVDVADLDAYADFLASGDPGELEAAYKGDIDGDGAITLADKTLLEAGGSSVPATCGDYERVVSFLLDRTGGGGDAYLRRRVLAKGLDDYVDELLTPHDLNDASFDSLLDRYRNYGNYAGRTDALAVLKDPVASQPFEFFEPGALKESFYFRSPIDSNYRVFRVLAELKMLRKFYSRRTLEAELTDFWFNHFNVFALGGRDTTMWALPDYERALQANVLGRFEDLVNASAEGVAMLEYLNLATNTADKQNENYARELQELHTIGAANVLESNVDAATKILTGYTYDPDLSQPDWHFTYVSESHSSEPATFLIDGKSLHFDGSIANDPAFRDECDDYDAQPGRALICELARSDLAARFIAEKLVARFVSELQPESIVADAEAVFKDNGTVPPVVGDLKAVMATILKHEDFRNAAYFRDKIARPTVFVAKLVRAIGWGAEGWSQIAGRTANYYLDSLHGIMGSLDEMDEEPFYYPTPDGFPEENDPWAEASGLMARFNLAERLVAKSLFRDKPLDGEKLVSGAAVRMAAWGLDEAEIATLPLADQNPAIVDVLVRRFVPGGLPAASRDAIAAALMPAPDFATKVHLAATLILSTPEFLAY